MRLLIVEDNPLDRDLAVRILRQEFSALEVTAVNNQQELDSLPATPHDLILTDYALRWSDGMAVLKTVKERWPETPVIMHTGTGSEDLAVAAMKAGADDYIVKSARNPARLRTAARLALEKARQRQAIVANRMLLAGAVDGMSEALALFDANRRLLMSNRKFNEHFTALADLIVPGVELRTLVARFFDAGLSVLPAGERNAWLGERLEALLRGDSEHLLQLSDGRWLMVRARRAHDGGTLLLYTDITELKQREARLAELARTNEVMAAALTDAAIGVLLTDPNEPDNPISFVNPAFTRITGYEANEAIGRNCRFLQGPLTNRADVARLTAGIAAREPVGVELLNYRRDGGEFWNALNVAPILDGEGHLRHFVGFVIDVTERVRLTATLEENNFMLAQAEQMAHLGHWRLVGNGGGLEWSDEARRIAGWPADVAALPDNFFDRFEAADRTRLLAAIGRTRNAGVPLELELPLLAADGTRRHVALKGYPDLGADRSIVGLFGTIQDVTEQHRLDEKLRFMAFHDPVTGLANRTRFREICAEATGAGDEAGGAARPFQIVVVGIDECVLFSRALGLEESGQIMAALAARLSQRLGSVVATARVADDEIALLVPGPAPSPFFDSVLAAAREALGAPIDWRGQTLRITNSIGVSRFPEDGATAEDLLRHATLALADARANEPGGLRRFSAALRAASEDRLAMRTRLHAALLGGDFELHYQPQVEHPSGRIVGCEALIRMRGENGDLIGPNRFIPLAESGGEMGELGRWILREACRQTAAWRRDGFDFGRVSINVSPRQLLDGRLPDDIRAALAAENLPAAAIKIEITEAVFAGQLRQTREAMEQIREIGVGIALDDFGTGYSSLSYLTDFPIDTLKLDRSFVRRLEANPRITAVVAAVTGMAQAIGLKIVAEGVETLGQIDALARLDCRFIQGFFYARPMPADAFTGLLRDGGGRLAGADYKGG
jgi:PAS domain S-box-containing protein/diguanylate cyclase (GGDEF)-like protein